jgi:DnaJ family protein C protein 2
MYLVTADKTLEFFSTQEPLEATFLYFYLNPIKFCPQITAETDSSNRFQISGCLPNRSKKDCMRRYKELAELIRAKKAAVAQAAMANPTAAKKP